MKVLALDTSGQHASAAIVFSDECHGHSVAGEFCLNARQGDKAYTHSDIMMPAVDQLFKLTGLKLENITHIAYTCGPGSFTGLRIGASCALGMSFALKIPAIPVPTLDALAIGAADMGFDGHIRPMQDARRGQVYTALFDSCLVRISDYQAVSVESLDHDQKTLFIGDGALANRHLLKDVPGAHFADNRNCFIRASSVGIWAILNPEGRDVGMIYVREPQAVREMGAQTDGDSHSDSRTCACVTAAGPGD